MKYLGTRNEQYDPVVTQDISGKQDKATLEADVAAKGFTKNTGTYSKPAGGIPKTDLSDSVQPLLEKRTLHCRSIKASQHIAQRRSKTLLTTANRTR